MAQQGHKFTSLKSHATLWPKVITLTHLFYLAECRSTRLFLMNMEASKYPWLEVLIYKKTCQFVVSSTIVLNIVSTMMADLGLLIHY